MAGTGRTSLTQKKQNTGVISYTSGDAEIKLSSDIVRRYLVSGQPENVTDQEIMQFMSLCRYQHLNPWVRECYIIKFGGTPATLVVGKEAFMKRANANPNYDGMESGIIVVSEDGIERREGTFKMKDEEVVGGWATVYRKDKSHPTRIEVSFDEYVGRKKDGSINGQWTSKPATMIRKVAQVQALREAFPSDFGGMFTAEEQGQTEDEFRPPIEVDDSGNPTASDEPQIMRRSEPKQEPKKAEPKQEAFDMAAIEAETDDIFK